MNILNQRQINRNKCIVVFNTFNVDTKNKLQTQWSKIDDPQLKKLCKYA